MKDKLEMMKKMSKMDKKMSDTDKQAKLNVLKDLSKQAGKAMMVKVVADSKEGLKEGLDVAKQKLEQETEVESDDEFGEMGEELEEESEGFEDAGEDMSNVNPDELDAQIEKLLKLKEKMKTATMKL